MIFCSLSNTGLTVSTHSVQVKVLVLPMQLPDGTCPQCYEKCMHVAYIALLCVYFHAHAFLTLGHDCNYTKLVVITISDHSSTSTLQLPLFEPDLPDIDGLRVGDWWQRIVDGGRLG